MNKPVELWVEALESGAYKQALGTLQSRQRFCCLGVACDLYQKVGPGDLEVGIGDFGYVHYDGHNSVLPKKVMTWLGIRSDTGGYYTGSLVGLNDNGTSFQQIAEVIRSNPDGLFTQGE